MLKVITYAIFIFKGGLVMWSCFGSHSTVCGLEGPRLGEYLALKINIGIFKIFNQLVKVYITSERVILEYYLGHKSQFWAF